jgi:hypothetical protein
VWRTGREGYYAVDVGNVEIRTKGAKFSRVQNSDRLDVTGPIVREENAKTARYEQLCIEQRVRTFIPVIMSSFAAPGAGTAKLVAILVESLQRIIGTTSAQCKKRVLRRIQTENMREIARNGIRGLAEHREEIWRQRRAREYLAQKQAQRSPDPTEVVAVAFLSHVQF